MLNEIVPGLVLRLNADLLLASGATVSPGAECHGLHWFLCFATRRSRGEWLPCFKEPGPGRQELSVEIRSGIEEWLASSCFFNPEHVWSASHDAILRAAESDPSRLGQRNWVVVYPTP